MGAPAESRDDLVGQIADHHRGLEDLSAELRQKRGALHLPDELVLVDPTADFLQDPHRFDHAILAAFSLDDAARCRRGRRGPRRSIGRARFEGRRCGSSSEPDLTWHRAGARARPGDGRDRRISGLFCQPAGTAREAALVRGRRRAPRGRGRGTARPAAFARRSSMRRPPAARRGGELSRLSTPGPGRDHGSKFCREFQRRESQRSTVEFLCTTQERARGSWKISEFRGAGAGLEAGTGGAPRCVKIPRLRAAPQGVPSWQTETENSTSRTTPSSPG